MSIGKTNTFIDIISTIPTKDSEGFAVKGDSILASVRAYFEPKNLTEKWANSATFSKVNALFRFRYIPGLQITPDMVIVRDRGRYKIISAEDVRSRHMYWECLCEKTEGSG
jgi:head-tail adaptor